MVGRKTWFFISAGLVALSASACATKSAAPVVYGSQPQWQGRVYNSVDEIADERARADARRAVREARSQRARGRQIEPQIEPQTAQTVSSDLSALRSAPSISVEEGDAPALIQANATPGERPGLSRADADVTAPRSQRFDYDAKPIYLNARERRETAAAALNATPVTSADQASTVIVRPGDTVYAIARRTAASPTDIIRLNNLKQPYLLEVDQRLRVPNGQSGVTSGGKSAARAAPAPVPARSDRTHVVRAGDTLFSISRSTGVPIAALARVNDLAAPYTLSVGKMLRIPGTDNAQTQAARDVAPATASGDRSGGASGARTQPEKVVRKETASRDRHSFDWPVKGAILATYSDGEQDKRNDGINIAAPEGTPVLAAADGEVVYRGADLEGYGNLLLIKHDAGYVTAYAYNEAMLVRKGDRVKKGQVIARVGQTGAASEPQLHFEIRQNLQAVDPLAFLDN